MYIITNGSAFCKLTEHGGVKCTLNQSEAMKFETTEEARAVKSRAPRRLKKYYIADAETLHEIASTKKKKRVQFGSTMRNLVYTRDKGKCYLCGEFISYDNFTIDHVVPLDKGGDNTVDNLRCCCGRCNIMKGNQSLDEFHKRIVGIAFNHIKEASDKKEYEKIDAMYKIINEKFLLKKIYQSVEQKRGDEICGMLDNFQSQ